ncbi:hypothetical protein F5148DRAFT_1284720 [Russula earlei]|uniref:Uncharacterized protein n=1 Tax=Russula earlei TaxID=71964 RepID=A0ACC0U861_9AGAM|nr:hypothetical protein F5148DRAFT_1284720 [Russula earlei]
MPSAVTVNTQCRSPNFDKLAFRRYVKNIGRAYQKQAIELISLCRTFVHVQKQSPDSDANLGMALRVVDDALRSAAEVKNKTSAEVDNKFETAIDTLSAYEAVYHPKDSMSNDSHMKTVRERMTEATKKDKSSSGILNTLKEKLQMKPAPDAWSEPTKVVEFLLFKSLPDDKPTIVKQEVGKGSKLEEILWTFSRYKDGRRLTLGQNPHCYELLPPSREAYGSEFRRDPITNFWDTAKICVLVDRLGRLYLESGQNSRAFDNVWIPKDAIIFKDVCGRLEGETIVGASIKGLPNLRYREGPQPDVPSTNSRQWKPIQDWREPIRAKLPPPGFAFNLYSRFIEPG